ncbi:citrate synthase [Candidatus Solirubrobacter pratensis]|uniref:citrate synthase n=1 Tax=Candidatus Solirubrobacter pratensis TaxID=1298857 RepID=UPI000429F2AC|nr:citrate synthase [Candidatus Solirubrobacter pratensis]
MLSAAEAARRLGVKPETLYAYVSRGMLTRHPAPDGRRSLFERAEIERLAARNRRGGRAGALEVVIDTEVTLIDPAGALYYRGHDATRLARERTYEEVAELLWADARGPRAGGDDARALRAGGDAARGPRAGGHDAAESRAGGDASGSAPWVAAGGGAVAAADAVVARGARLVDRLRVIVALAAAADPLRNDLRPPVVRHAARGLIAAMVDGLPRRSEAVDGTVAARLWSRLHDVAPEPARLRALNAALVLLADHELAVSALAARVAASAWADPYLVVLAGLSALGGPLHGGAPGAVERLFAQLREPGDVAAALGERLAAGESLPGFGHKIYRGADPRAETLLGLVREASPERQPVIDEVLRLAGRHDGPKPNVDLALGAMSDAFGFVPGAAETIFAIARTAGFIAQALEEYPHRLRFRAKAAYVGAAPEAAAGRRGNGPR